MPSDLTTRNGEKEPRLSPLFLLALAALIFLSSWGCVALTQYTGRVAAIWIANAILLAGLLKHPRHVWPQLIGVGFLARRYDRARPLLTGAGLALANILEVLAIELPMRWLGFDRDFSRTESLVSFYLLVVGAACVLSSAVGAATLHFTLGTPFYAAAFSWYGSDALGLCLLVPFFMCVKLSAAAEMFSGE
jgi:integral membrane sensor domain MASE1